MIDYSDEGWQGRNWNTAVRQAAFDTLRCSGNESGSNDEINKDMPGKSLDGFPSI